MQAVKAFIRPEKVEEVIAGLEAAGVKGMTLIDVMSIGENIDPEQCKFSIKVVGKYMKVSKLEIICSDEQAGEIVPIIRENAFSGQKGDGLIYVMRLDEVVKIRTGELDVKAL